MGTDAFREQAARQAVGTLNKIAETRKAQSIHDLKAAKQAVTSALQTLEAALTAPVDAADDIATMVEQLAASANASAANQVEQLRKDHEAQLARVQQEHEAQVAEVRKEHEARVADVRKEHETQLAKAHKEHEAQRANAEKELEARLAKAQKEHEAQQAKAQKELEAQLGKAQKEHETQLAKVQKELGAVRADAADGEAAREKQATRIQELSDALAEAQAAVESGRSEQAAIEKDLKAAESRATTAWAELQALQQQATTSRAELAATTSARAALEREVAAARALAESAAGEAARLTAQHQGALDEMRREHAETMRDQMVASPALPLNELITVFHALDAASSVGDVLTTLVGGLAREFSRVALFRVQGNRLEGMQQAGFEFDRDISKLVFPLTVDSMLTRAATSAKMETLIAPPETTGALVPFGGTPGCALALPVAIHGETLAVIYADDVDRTEGPSSGPHLPAQFAEVLFHHAQLVLLRIATEQKTMTELREYATMLVNEIEYGYNSDVDAGRTPSECVTRLKDALECTRRIYSQRVAGEKPAAETLLDEQLGAVIGARTKTPFGRDLASLVQAGTGAKGASRPAKAG